MRTMPALLFLSLGVAIAAPTCAQTPATALPIPLPPGVAVQLEMDGKDADLLGMVKGLLAGAVTPKTAAGKATGPDASANSFQTFLGDGQLSALLKDIHHLHVVSFKPAPATVVTIGNNTPAAVSVTVGNNTVSAVPTDYLAFYEKPFVAEGGHRLLYITQGTQVVTVGFDEPRGFAAVVASGDTVYVVRADGYPDMAVIGGLLRTFGSAIPSLTMPAMSPATPTPAPPAHKATPKAAHAKARKA